MEPARDASHANASELSCTIKAESARPNPHDISGIDTSASSDQSDAGLAETELGVPDPLIQQLLNGINFGEGVRLHTDSLSTASRVVNEFRRFDINGNGTIERNEMAFVLQTRDPGTWTEDRVERIFRGMDRNSDDAVDFAEFVAWAFKATEDGDDFREACNLTVLVPRRSAAPVLGATFGIPSKSIHTMRFVREAATTALAVTKVGSQILAAVGYESGDVCIVDLEEEKCLRTLHLGDRRGSTYGGKPINALQFSTDRSMLACAADALYIFNVGKGDCLARLSNDPKSPVKDCGWGACDSHIVVAEGAASKIWDLDFSQRGMITGSVHRIYRSDKLPAVYGCCFSDDGGVISVGRSQGVFCFRKPKECVPDGRRRSSTRSRSKSPTVVRPIQLGEHFGHVHRCCLSTCGQHLLTMSSDKMPAVWDMPRAAFRNSLIGHTAQITAGAFHYVEGILMAITGSIDGTTRIWNALSGCCLALVDASAPVLDIAVADESKEGTLRIVTATRECLQVWEINSDVIRGQVQA